MKETTDTKSMEDLFKILSNPKRRKILKACSSERHSAVQISKLLHEGYQSTRKHLAELQHYCMIQSDNGVFATTPLGLACLQCANSLEFLEKHGQFFTEHSFGDTNSHLLKRIGDLNNCNLIYGIHLVLSKWSKIITEAQEFVNLIFLQPPILVADSLKPKINQDIKIRLLIGKNSNITECNEFVDKLGLRKPTNLENFEKKIADTVQINLIMSEKEACVIFPGNDGVTDMHGNFFGNDDSFLKWCSDFFQYKWKNARSFARIR
jgi:predicted transcriptional regulator